MDDPEFLSDIGFSAGPVGREADGDAVLDADEEAQCSFNMDMDLDGRSEGEDEDDGGDDATPVPAEPRFTYDGPAMPQPSATHDGTEYDLHTGPMWSVKASAIGAHHVAQHLRDLTCVPNKDKKLPRFAKRKQFHVGYLKNGRLFMPPGYAKLAFPNARRVGTSYTRGLPMRDGVAFRGALYSYPPQQQAAARYMTWLRDNVDCPSCVVSMPCGHGKTAWVIWVVSALKRVALVLAHTIPLVDQWIAELRKFLPGARIGYVKRDAIRIDDVDAIVASTQSLLSHIAQRKPYLQRLFRAVGTVCMDEGHHAVANTFAQVLSACPALYRLVVTATVRRKDGLMPQLMWLAGPCIFQSFRNLGEAHAVCVQYGAPAWAAEWADKKSPNLQQLLNTLTQDPVFTALACRIVLTLLARQRRRVLICTQRVQHVEELRAVLAEALKDRADLRRDVDMFVEDAKPRRGRRRKGESEEDAAARNLAALYAWEDSGPHGVVKPFSCEPVAAVVQGMKTFDRFLAYESTVVVTTAQMMEEGVSYKQWDTLVDLTCLSDVEQIVGRILRMCPTKRVPLVVKIWAGVSMLRALFWQSYKYFKEENFRRVFHSADALEDLPPEEFWARYDKPAPAVL